MHHPAGSGYQFAISSLLFGITLPWARNEYQIFESSLRPIGVMRWGFNVATDTLAEIILMSSCAQRSIRLWIRGKLSVVGIHSSSRTRPAAQRLWPW